MKNAFEILKEKYLNLEFYTHPKYQINMKVDQRHFQTNKFLIMFPSLHSLVRSYWSGVYVHQNKELYKTRSRKHINQDIEDMRLTKWGLQMIGNKNPRKIVKRSP